MARIRTIKPDFWTDDKLVELDFATRLFFIGTWNHADDNGNLRRSAKSLKMKIFPADAIDCEPLVQSLIAHGMLMEYSVSGEVFLHIRCFAKHQVINRKSKSAIPLPPWLTGDGGAPAPPDAEQQAARAHDPNSHAAPNLPSDGSLNAPPDESGNSMPAHGALTEDSLTEKEEEKEGSKPKGSNDDVGNLIRGSGVDNSAASSSLSADEIAALLTQWECERGKNPRFAPDGKQIVIWTRCGITSEQLRAAYTAAVVQRQSDRDVTAVNAGFLDAFVAKALAPPRAVKPPLRGMTDAQLEAEGKRLGVSTHGLLRDQCIARIEAKRTEQRGGNAP
ncbi:hypothetical protein BC1002_6533 [Paraburkholderia atlantica]|uniref:Uncharacterized protein n=1 Tax=Paraburkholderia atlantica TaxID=2654982 RepID=D5WMC8_PARAM|nr:hypothetical protein [Paraburkholderia atlantica]ADG20374.1 hypothetical protein BC1002_6533 [Paraburkholderia atlantica]